MLLGADGKLAGFVAVADPIKPGAAEAIAKLHALGLEDRHGDRRQRDHRQGGRLASSASTRCAPACGPRRSCN